VRLLGYWIVFMILLVVFVPAFSVIFSPPACIPKECPECPTCPPCPECPATTFPRIYPYYMSVAWLGDFVSVIQVYGVSLRPLSNYKYFILINTNRYNIAYSEYCTGEVDEGGNPICDFIDFRYLNSTHSYVFFNDRATEFHIELYGQGLKYENVHVIIIVVPEHYTLQDVLRDLQRVTIP